MPAAAPLHPSLSYLQHQSVPQVNLSDPAVANAFMAQYSQQPGQHQQSQRGGGHGGRGGGFQNRPRPQPVDKPKSKVAIPGQEPWILVYTKYGRRFAYNPVKNASYWRIPEKLMPAILELDKARIRAKAGIAPEGGEEGGDKEAARPTTEPEGGAEGAGASAGEKEHDYDSSEYEEVEVTDDEGEDGQEGDEEGNAPKRQRTEEPPQGPVEFTEADIAAQLAAMGAGGYGAEDEEMGDWDQQQAYEEEEDGMQLSESDTRELFKDMLNDFRINPYSPFDKLIEEGKVFDDPRYTVLPNMKTRREVWEEWSREKIVVLKEQRAKEAKKDPKIPYVAFLQEKATPKLYWPEFRRKYKKEDCMKDTKLADKDREKMYREHINRLKLPQSTLKADLKKLLESCPLSALNNSTPVPDGLPPQVLGDVRWISLPPQVRDPFVEAYVKDLAGPPSGEQAEEDDASKKAREERRKRESALRERERQVAEEKRRKEKRLQFERARLREEERELERAMQVGKKGLQSQLGLQQQQATQATGDGSPAGASAENMDAEPSTD